eukprot:CAMPEP_0180227512 /NCGR_PEP_ID=MMETSP0987-20121128/24170_1 /TAXON_ID=697907 /ORGANISM="non described non described, Strain CCMP2293" /LENGTH=195 /DNA_ID=CAMNT_0022191445 /DNA_START=53 /DNA_END=637 /DNA_ORIENTATION=-
MEERTYLPRRPHRQAFPSASFATSPPACFGARRRLNQARGRGNVFLPRPSAVLLRLLLETTRQRTADRRLPVDAWCGELLDALIGGVEPVKVRLRDCGEKLARRTLDRFRLARRRTRGRRLAEDAWRGELLDDLLLGRVKPGKVRLSNGAHYELEGRLPHWAGAEGSQCCEEVAERWRAQGRVSGPGFSFEILAH